MITPHHPERDRRAVEVAMRGQREDLRALAARYRLGALVADLDALAAPLGDALRAEAWQAGVAVRALLEVLDEGAGDVEWRARTYGEAQ